MRKEIHLVFRREETLPLEETPAKVEITTPEELEEMKDLVRGYVWVDGKIVVVTPKE